MRSTYIQSLVSSHPVHEKWFVVWLIVIKNAFRSQKVYATYFIEK